MTVERRWVYEGVASSADANGCVCIFCEQRIVNESQAGHWVEKAIEDNPDADYVTQSGYAHWECTQRRLAEQRRSRFSIPEPPQI